MGGGDIAVGDKEDVSGLLPLLLWAAMGNQRGYA